MNNNIEWFFGGKVLGKQANRNERYIFDEFFTDFHSFLGRIWRFEEYHLMRKGKNTKAIRVEGMRTVFASSSIVKDIFQSSNLMTKQKKNSIKFRQNRLFRKNLRNEMKHFCLLIHLLSRTKNFVQQTILFYWKKLSTSLNDIALTWPSCQKSFALIISKMRLFML